MEVAEAVLIHGRLLLRPRERAQRAMQVRVRLDVDDDAADMGGTVRRLNLGCGDDVRPSWVNVDLHMPSTLPRYDFRRGDAKNLAFPAEEFDVVLLNHVLHLFTYDEAEVVLNECVRVLKFPGELIIVDADIVRLTREWGDRVAVERLIADEVESTEDGKLLRWVSWHSTRRSLWSYSMLAERLIRRGLSVTPSPSHEIEIGRPHESFTIVGVKP
jgi:SAM-dependent methyltransferase